MSEHTTETVIANQRETIRRLIEERDQHEAEAKRQHEFFHHEHLRANNLECTVRNLELGIEQLTRELAEANRTIDLQCRQIAHQARQCQEIEDERDAARELLRRFRELFPDKWHVREVDDFATVVKYQASAVCRDYDAQLGDAAATKAKILEAVRKIEPEVTR